MNASVHLYRDEAGEWRWKRVEPNGREVSNSGEGYRNFLDAEEQAKRNSQPGDRIVHDDEPGGGPGLSTPRQVKEEA
jgi:uncharacterized protein YegP (UPF0339 family)